MLVITPLNLLGAGYDLQPPPAINQSCDGPNRYHLSSGSIAFCRDQAAYFLHYCSSINSEEHLYRHRHLSIAEF